jgi:hypothetical protein
MNAVGVQHRNRMDPERGPYRAIVATTYVTDSPLRMQDLVQDGVPTAGRDRRSPAQVTCDLILTTSQIALSRVPVAQPNFGVNNIHGLWVPRGSTRLISSGAERTAPQFRRTSDRGSPNGEPSDFSDLDGDMVLVDFIEKDIDYPIVRTALQHEQSARQVIVASGTRGSPGADDHYVGHYGTEFRIDASGNLLIDTVGAFEDIQSEDESVAGGEVRVRVKASQRCIVEMDGTDVLEVWKDGGQVRIDLGTGASERLVLGDAFKSYLDIELGKVNTFWSTVYALHGHPDPITGPSGPPTVPQVETITPMLDSTLSDLAKTKKS